MYKDRDERLIVSYTWRLCVHSELFYTVIDMLSVLVHGTLISDGQEENKKVYHNLIKKLKVQMSYD